MYPWFAADQLGCIFGDKLPSNMYPPDGCFSVVDRSGLPSSWGRIMSIFRTKSLYRVLDPQPEGEISSCKIRKYSGRGLGITFDGDFIPFPDGENPTGVGLVRRNGLWFWSRGHDYDLAKPVDEITVLIKDLVAIFSDKQLRQFLTYSLGKSARGSGFKHRLPRKV